ncbi:MAG: hypothetical protein M1823_000194 [Watsoniomyces obsoletus]|nr:MAG: hypothetical protein M1823_000194 [Watsoniomyces obsoletus]
MDVLVQCETIKDLDLSDNQLSGTLDPRIDRLQHLVALNLAGNTVSELPESLGGLHALRTLNLSNNSFTSLPFNVLAHMSLTELRASNNRIAGTLVSTESTTMETLQYLDLTHNELASLVDSQELHLPSIREFYVSNNRLTSLPAVTGWEELLTLDASHNRLTDFPTGLADLQKIKQIALKGNNIREVDPRISTIVSLEKIDLSGNPLRRKKYLTMGTEALKEDLRSQLEPEVEATEGEAAHNAAGDLGPTQRLAESDAREGWPLKPGGVLDRSSTQMEDLDAVTLQATAAENNIRSLLLHHNLLSLIPPTLDVVASTLTTLDLSHNKLNAQDYLTTSLDLPHLSTLNLSCNTISTLEPLQEHLSAPRLTTLDISANRIVALPSLGASFPALTKLIANDNAISDITVDSLRGLKIIDLRNNDIGHVPPHLGLLTEIDRLDLGGNRFRVPSWNVLAKGTKETLSWLRDKIPLDERDVVPVEELD